MNSSSFVKPGAGFGFCLALTAGWAQAAAPGDFYFPSTGVTVEHRAVLLGIDDYLLPLRENLSPYFSTPRYRAAAVVRPSRDDPRAPDQVAAHFYGSVLKEGGRYRMWYYAVGLKRPGDPSHADPAALTQGPVCYAESEDGLVWTKPRLGQLEFGGSRSNNAVALPDASIEGVHVIVDPADPDPERRYKMVYNPHNGKTWVIRTATSRDGLHWQAATSFGIDQFLETSSFYRFNRLYVVNGQRITFSEDGHDGGRQGRAVVSPDFARWLPGDFNAFDLPEPLSPPARGPRRPYDQVHLGVGAASFGAVAVGFYGIWHNTPGDEDSQKRWGWFGYGKISCDLGLVISNDGVHFREPAKGRVFISRLDTPATRIPGKSYPTILTQSGNGIVETATETRIYYGRWLNADYGMGYSGEVAVAILPRDRWGALGLFPRSNEHYAYRAHGSVWSAPIRLPEGGCTLALNAEGARGLSVEVSDANFALLPGYSGAEAGRPTETGGLACPVQWGSGPLSPLGGQTVRFKINFDAQGGVNPRLFAVDLSSR